MTTDPDALVNDYVALWNEPDPQVRAGAIRALWTPDGGQVLQPPQELLDQAIALGFRETVLEARGYAALEARVAHAHAEFIAPGEYAFVVHDAAQRVRDVVKFRWAMVSAGGGDAAAIGLDVFLLAADGRIRDDVQFIER
jgi:hypothetical protein